MPNSAERRSTIKGPKEMSPKFNGPSLRISHERVKTIAPGISSGALIVNSLDISLAGRTIDKHPTIKESTNKNARDLHQIRRGRKLKNVINIRKQAVEILQIELDQTGVSKNERIQKSLIRGSRTRSQPDFPETY